MELTSILSDGFALHESILDGSQVEALIDHLQRHLTKAMGRGGVRNLLGDPEIRALAHSREVRQLVQPVLGENFF